ncbi:PREDICTED: embryonic protein UVS.2-like [Nanorana parkeri]|uniref:embryonic protein UVS.2-like n=1 Tax=Nanorana parkeri TaxID=125878 RepID=UPI000853F253|nr:PREDICTED: embryonic protein UVS.2-like [Nanorana parkeri]
MCCVCFTLPSQKLQQRKKREITGTPGDTTQNKSVSDLIHEANKGPIYSKNYRIKDLDIATSTKRGNSVCPKGICLWPKSDDEKVYVPYVISSDHSLFESQVIQYAMMSIEGASCIRFIKQTSEADYISFQPLEGCWSALGRSGGVQTISLGPSKCTWTAVATHEILHALGLQHEHVRKDRDNYIKVLWDNIEDGYASSYEISDTLNIDLTKYDYESIMHYAKTTFSKNNMPTMEAVPDKTVSFGENIGMSALDIIKINTLYNCSTKSDSKISVGQTTTTTTPTTTTTTTTTKPTTTTTTTKRTPRTTTTTTTTKPRPVLDANNVCGGLLTNPQGVITSPNFPNNYPIEAYCHWNISTTSKVKITFTHFDVEGSMSSICAFDKLQVYNGQGLLSSYKSEFCGKTLPPSITSKQNTMQIVFSSDHSASWTGFRLVYAPGIDVPRVQVTPMHRHASSCPRRQRIGLERTGDGVH